MNLLTYAGSILAIDARETDTAFYTDDQVFEKHVIDGYSVHEVGALPDDYVPGKYGYDNGFVPKSNPPVRQPEQPPNRYKDQRVAEYPPMTDYLDGIVKGDQAQVQAYIDACLAVKAKYPKSE